MKEIIVEDKRFRLCLGPKVIDDEVRILAGKINEDYKNKDLLIISVLNGSFMFTSDLAKKINVPCHISFVKVSSYEGTKTTGIVKQLIGLNEPLIGRDVLIVDELIDTGTTIEVIIDLLSLAGAKSVKVATLLLKPDCFKKDFKIDYVGLEIANNFVIGYGLDYNGYCRNLPGVYRLVEEDI